MAKQILRHEEYLATVCLVVDEAYIDVYPVSAAFNLQLMCQYQALEKRNRGHTPQRISLETTELSLYDNLALTVAVCNCRSVSIFLLLFFPRGDRRRSLRK